MFWLWSEGPGADEGHRRVAALGHTVPGWVRELRLLGLNSHAVPESRAIPISPWLCRFSPHPQALVPTYNAGRGSGWKPLT